ncbi:acetyl-CoA carboxylase, carboxyltransferase subunit beta [Candidatus Marinimicrobia bacterium]|jgi:acetyl-CoA carboxylase carboxyl transferase subunit beta|nr:acetyl-CoA carboxylase, carboxyltransferase subunit beta [Candidatus Neomarinimicrobiota bacterium]|tara:strand:+ start:5077 stop:5919 length:843 start_codon:yes stop_codon:yes gene_type:complete
MTEWFRRKNQNINTPIKKDTKEGMWIKCPDCGEVVYSNLLISTYYLCSSCSYHFNYSSQQYIDLLLDKENRVNIGNNIFSNDPLKFSGIKEYKVQLDIAQNKTGTNDAIMAFSGSIDGLPLVLATLNFSFIGGSMGSVVGEVISQSIDYAYERNLPLLIISASGGARMQEGAISLMQLAKTSSKMSRFSKNGGLYISLLTNPTMGGASASFSMQGDIIIAEPNALIGFAGQRVIKQTIGEDLPKGFQKSEFLLKRGFIDHIIPRNKLKNNISNLIKFFYE